MSTATRTGVFLFVPHSHWEGAVFKTRHEYLDEGMSIVLRALHLLRRHAHYRFVLDQTCLVRPFLERYPQYAAEMAQLVADGRLEIAGGMIVMPDVNMPGGESCVRQILYGKNYFRRVLGADVKVGWQLDTFGHHAQMPQLMQLAGYDSFWSQRGVPDLGLPTEFWWQGIDGTRVRFFWLPQNYAVTYGSPRTLAQFAQFMDQRYDSLAANCAGADRVGPAGADVCLPEEHVPEFIAAPAARTGAGSTGRYELRIGVPSDYERLVAQRFVADGADGAATVQPTVVYGELNPIFQGAYSSRIELKQRTRTVERVLLTGEKLGALLYWIDRATDGADGADAVDSAGRAENCATSDSQDMERAWEPALFNQAHDLMSGVMTDHVFDDTIRGFDFSMRLGTEILETRLRRFLALRPALCASAETPVGAVAVFNSLGHHRTDNVEIVLGFIDPAVVGFTLADQFGSAVDCQVIHAERTVSGSLVTATVAFVADVSALAARHYFALPCRDPGKSAAHTVTVHGTVVVDNQFYQITVDAERGTLGDITVKDQQWQVLRAAGNVIAKEEDRGDLWELYRPLNGAQFVTMKQRHPAPPLEHVDYSWAGAVGETTLTAGPVYREFRVAHSIGDTCNLELHIRLYERLRRIEFRTALRNQEQFVRYRVLFPTTIVAPTSTHEIPFGAIERPDGIELPAQHWVDHNDGERGLALLNRGLPGNNVADGVMMLSLMRSTEIVAYAINGGYEGQGSASGFEIGKLNQLEYALLPHSGRPGQAAIPHAGWDYNHPLIARAVPVAPTIAATPVVPAAPATPVVPAAPTTAAVPAAPTATVAPVPPAGEGAPNRRDFAISQPAVVLSALKVTEAGGAVIVRLYESHGAPARAVEVVLPVVATAVEVVGLMEDVPPPNLPADKRGVTWAAGPTGTVVTLDFQPFEIKTLRVRSARGGV